MNEPEYNAMGSAAEALLKHIQNMMDTIQNMPPGTKKKQAMKMVSRSGALCLAGGAELRSRMFKEALMLARQEAPVKEVLEGEVRSDDRKTEMSSPTARASPTMHGTKYLGKKKLIQKQPHVAYQLPKFISNKKRTRR